MMETIEELVAQRRGYKYLNKDGVSPYQNFKYDLTPGTEFKTQLNADIREDCGRGWNLATLQWIIGDTNILSKIIVEFSIPKGAKIIVPTNSTGKFRADIIRLEKVHDPLELFPAIKDIAERLKNYNPINPITAETMPSKTKIKKIMAQVRDRVWTQVWAQVWTQVRDQVGAQVGAQVWTQVRAQVRDQVEAQVGAQVWTQVRAQVRDQVEDQVGVIAYYAVKLFMGIPYEHPAFDLVRLGIVVVNVNGKYKVFGKNGKYLGEI
uniref:Uncharacterized protein n=1 Tax=viral metagenome TaxID=1070528 RepID=A0A6M3LIZ8_9ZZZZ